MNKKTVLLLKRYAKKSGFSWKRYRKEYLSLPWNKRFEYKLKLKTEL